MWDPFNKKAKLRAAELEIQTKADKERGDKLEARLDAMVAEQEAAKEAIAAELFAAEETARLAEEEKKRKEAKKVLATEQGIPYIDFLDVAMDPDNEASLGAIEMDWNVHFIEMLQRHGYVGVSDEDAVDQWFRDVCKSVVLETYENEDQSGHVTREEVGDGRTEYS
jgi:hypothetical protein